MAGCSMIIYLSIFLASTEAATHMREYNPQIPIPIPPVEGPIQWCTWGILFPEFEHGTCAAVGLNTPYAPYLGLIIAGKAEFPWIVDVSNQDLYEESHSIGNLVSSYWVATAGHVYLDWAEADQCGPSEANNYQVKFCTNYLLEDFYKYQENFNEPDLPVAHLYNGRDDEGTRIITQIVRHPLCTRFSREWDLMMLKLNIPIRPLLPEIAYMPFYQRTFGVISIPTVTRADLESRICYVATYGRQFRDLPEPVNHGFKTKYRSYPVDWSVCRARRAELCALNGKYVDLNAEWFFDQGSEAFGNNQLMCFEIRNYNGAVCNHDHGAPMVCGGEVVGFVVRGVNIELCRSGSPYPFVVVKIDTFSGEFFSGKRLGPMTSPMTPTTPFIIPLQNFTRLRSKEINWQQYAPFWKN